MQGQARFNVRALPRHGLQGQTSFKHLCAVLHPRNAMSIDFNIARVEALAVVLDTQHYIALFLKKRQLDLCCPRVFTHIGQ